MQDALKWKLSQNTNSRSGATKGLNHFHLPSIWLTNTELSIWTSVWHLMLHSSEIYLNSCLQWPRSWKHNVHSIPQYNN